MGMWAGTGTGTGKEGRWKKEGAGGVVVGEDDGWGWKS